MNVRLLTATESTDMQYREHPKGRRHHLPPLFENKLLDLVQKKVSSDENLQVLYTRPEDFCKQAFILPGPTATSQLYAVICDFGPGNEQCMFCLYDPQRQLCSSKVVFMPIHWQVNVDELNHNDPFRQRFLHPYVTYRDFDGSGKMALVVERISHNGTGLNAVDYDFFDINPSLSLTRVFSLQTRCLINDGKTIITREITPISPMTIRVSAFRKDAHTKEPKPIGNKVLKKSPETGRYVEISSEVLDQSCKEFISNPDEEWRYGQN